MAAADDAASPPTRPHASGGLSFHARVNARGADTADAAVIDEVVRDDCYGLRLLEPAIRALAGGEAPTLFDVGGNVGAFGTWFLSRFPRGRAVAFEPFPENRLLYERHLADNGFAALGVVEPRAVKYTDLDDLVLVTFPGHEGLTAVMTQDGVEALPREDKMKIVRVPVETTTLEDAVRRHGVDRVHVCKMDCEYGEWDIFGHADPALWDRVDFIVGEFHGSAVKFADLLARTFPDRPTAQVATFPKLGQFWVGPKGADAVLAAAERAFWKHVYEGARAEAKMWRQRFARVVNRFPVKPFYRMWQKFKGVDAFYQFEDGPLDLGLDDHVPDAPGPRDGDAPSSR